jgi:hypothetical protein
MSEPVVDAVAAANPGNNGAAKPFDMRIVIGVIVVIVIVGIILAGVFGARAAEEAKAKEAATKAAAAKEAAAKPVPAPPPPATGVKPPGTMAPATPAPKEATPVVTGTAPTAGKGAATPWKCLKGFTAPMRKDARGDVQCMSNNRKDCVWKADEAQCNAAVTTPVVPLDPLTCGDGHKAAWGGPGYDNPDHWCSKVKRLI